VDFAVNFSSDFSGKMEEFVQNGLKIFKNFRRTKSTVDYVADPRSCNSLPFSRKQVDQLSTLIKKIQRLSTVGQLSKKNPATVDLSSKVDCRLQGLLSDEVFD
jgi:hypothetical protein